MNQLEQARALFEAHVGRAATVEELTGARNHVFKITGEDGHACVLKIYRERDEITGNSELAIYRALEGSARVRRLIAGAATGAEVPFTLVEYVEGRTLLEGIDGLAAEPGALTAAVRQIRDFAAECAAHRVEGFGPMDDQLRGAHTTWLAQLEGFLTRTDPLREAVARPGARELLDTIAAELRRFLARERRYFEEREAALTPVDLNLNNFLLRDDGGIVALDLETVWGADPLVALGEWAGHAYGTPHYAPFLEAWGPVSPFELRAVRFYATMSNYAVLLYVLGEGGEGAETWATLTPWGNRIPIRELVGCHRAALAPEAAERPLPEALALRHPPLVAGGWGVKADPGQHQRSQAFAETLARIGGARKLAGITRVADITLLDETGIHVYQSVRPDAEQEQDTFTVFAGWGRTKEECRVKAIAEGMERYCAERRAYRGEIVTGSWAELGGRHALVHPADFNMPADAAFSDREVLEWVRAVEVHSGQELLVTANTVFAPYAPEAGRALFRWFTTGLGAGNVHAEAAAHGLCEVIERDASALNRILRDRPPVDLESVDSARIRELVQRMRAAHLEVVARHISPPDVGVPVFSVICDDTRLRDPLYISGGYGAHPNKEAALFHALNEAAQSRVGTISGAREDLEKHRRKHEGLTHAQVRSKYAYWFDTAGAVDYASIPSYELPTALDDFALMCGALREAGFERVLLVDLSHEELGLRTVKVLVPGVERYSFKMTCVGERARSRYRERFGKELPLPK